MHQIRLFHPDDEPLLADLYEATVRRWAPALYSPEQVEAWAIAARDSERIHAMLTGGQTFVAVDSNDQPIGFSGVEPDGRIASLYIAADSTRQGVGTALLQHVIRHAAETKIPPLWAEASFLSRALFERHGFVATDTEYIVLNGVEFKRWIVRQPIQARSASE